MQRATAESPLVFSRFCLEPIHKLILLFLWGEIRGVGACVVDAQGAAPGPSALTVELQSCLRVLGKCAPFLDARACLPALFRGCPLELGADHGWRQSWPGEVTPGVRTRSQQVSEALAAAFGAAAAQPAPTSGPSTIASSTYAWAPMVEYLPTVEQYHELHWRCARATTAEGLNALCQPAAAAAADDVSALLFTLALGEAATRRPPLSCVDVGLGAPPAVPWALACSMALHRVAERHRGSSAVLLSAATQLVSIVSAHPASARGEVRIAPMASCSAACAGRLPASDHLMLHTISAFLRSTIATRDAEAEAGSDAHRAGGQSRAARKRLSEDAALQVVAAWAASLVEAARFREATNVLVKLLASHGVAPAVLAPDSFAPIVARSPLLIIGPLNGMTMERAASFLMAVLAVDHGGTDGGSAAATRQEFVRAVAKASALAQRRARAGLEVMHADARAHAHAPSRTHARGSLRALCEPVLLFVCVGANGLRSRSDAAAHTQGFDAAVVLYSESRALFDSLFARPIAQTALDVSADGTTCEAQHALHRMHRAAASAHPDIHVVSHATCRISARNMRQITRDLRDMPRCMPRARPTLHVAPSPGSRLRLQQVAATLRRAMTSPSVGGRSRATAADGSAAAPNEPVLTAVRMADNVQRAIAAQCAGGREEEGY